MNHTEIVLLTAPYVEHSECPMVKKTMIDDLTE